MSNHTLEIGGVKYVPFKSGLKHPKLSWVIMMLNKYGIKHVLEGAGLRGQLLYVQAGTVELCSGILNQELAVFEAKTLNFEEGPTTQIRILINDLPNDHEFFEAQIAGQTIDLESVVHSEGVGEVTEIVPPTAVVVEDMVTESVTINPDGSIEAEVIASSVVEVDDSADEEDEDGWDFEDIEDDPLADDPPLVEEVEVVLDPDLDKVAEPVPAEPKPKKEKPVPQEAVDPDFETAAPPTVAYSNLINGTEFLIADEVLQFEDVSLVDVKKPIRMYDVDSSTLSAIGCKELSKDPSIVTMYVRFKSGGKYYRYNPVPKADYNNLLNEIVRKNQGFQEASAGSLFHHTIKVKGEEGLIKCQRLDDNGWVIVQPKSERTKDIKLRAKK